MTSAEGARQRYLFGGDQPWDLLEWTSSDDRVRGGSSYSKLSCDPPPSSSVARFHGNLDIETLGGAGFASQRTTGEDRRWDLSGFGGLEIDIQESDGKQYTLILKDELLPKSPNGREQSTVSWEYDFRPSSSLNQSGGDGEKLFFKFDQFKPTYRGREQKDAKPLDLKNVKRISLMMRSFFGTQQGDFSLSIRSIAAKATISPEDLAAKDFKNSACKENEKEVSKVSAEDVSSPQHWTERFSAFCVVS